jgi:aminopeptidase N
MSVKMKKYLFILLAPMLYNSVLGQDMNSSLVVQDQAKLNEIYSLINGQDYLQALIGWNDFIRTYPTTRGVYYNRGITRLRLNDVQGAKRDFNLELSLGLINIPEFIYFFTSKQSMVSRILKDLKEDVSLDSARDFRPVILPKDTIQGALRPARTCFDVYYYCLTVRIFPETKSIEGSNKIFFKSLSATQTIQIDLFPQLDISSIIWHGKNLDFKRIEGGVFVSFGEPIPEGSFQEIEVKYSGSPLVAKKPPWNGGLVWDKDKGKYLVGVACEHLGASVWWPNKDHLSDKPDSMTINIQVPKGYQGVSNGNLKSTRDVDNGYVNYEWFVSYPINNYNVTFYMGDFVNFNEQITDVGGTYQADYYVLPKNLEKAKKYYAQEKDILTAYGNIFGEYPFRRDGAGMVEAPFEGMEHQGAIAIGGEYGKSSNKRDYWTKEYDYLLIHETAHEWWGNSVAIGDMADAWINEGFATYAEALFAEEKYGYPKYVAAVAYDFDKILNIWPVVGELNINSNTFIGGDIYMKGAAMLNNLRCLMDNDSLFKTIIRDFYLKGRFRIVTTADFINHVKSYTNTDYKDFFNSFLYSDEPPILVCNYFIDKKNQLTLSYRWTNVGKDFTMPFCVAVNEKSKYIRLIGTTQLRTFSYENVKNFFLPNERHFNQDLVPENSFTYYWTSWPF